LGKLIDITGQRFGRLIVIKLDHTEKGKNRHSYWLCKCDCGNEKIIDKNSLVGGGTQSCGCLREERLKESHQRDFVDLKNQKIGRLKIIKRGEDYISPGGFHRIQWLCQCDCGNTKLIASSSLLSGGTKSCGCLARERTSEITKGGYGNSALNHIYYSYIKSAKKRNLNFDLSKEYFVELINENCYYCNCRPKQISKNLWNNGDYIYNGIDRVDSSKGYMIGNVVPCCGQCNRAKNSLPLNEFVDWIKSIHNNLDFIIENINCA
jgi:hypothetical protein